MADYVSILNKAVSGLGENNAANRQVIYQKARGAIDRKLRSMDPAPSEDAIAGQLSQLEEAINQVEGEQQLAALASESEPPAPRTPAEEPTAAPATPSAPAAPQEAPAQPALAVDAGIPAPNPPAGFVDDVILIDGIGEKTREALEDEGVVGISQVAAMPDAQLAAVTEKIGYPGFEQTQEWKKQADEMLGGMLPRSKTDQERLKKLQAERGENVEAPAADPAPQVADIPSEPKIDAPVDTPVETPSVAPTEMPTVHAGEVPVAPTPETLAPQQVTQPPTPAVAEPETIPPAPSPEIPAGEEIPSMAEPVGEPATQKAFADAIAELTKGRTGNDTPSVEPAPPAAPVSSAPPSPVQQPQVGTTGGAELRAGMDEPLAGSSDAPPYVGQIDGDPFAAKPSEDTMHRGDFGGTSAVPKPKRSFGKTLGCAGLLALLGGVAYGGWHYQDQVKEYGGKAITAVQELFGGSTNDSEPEAAPSDTGDGAQPADDKNDARLGTDDAAGDDSSAENTVPDAAEGSEVETSDGDAPRNILADPVQETPATVEVEGQDDPVAGEAGDDSAAQADENAAADGEAGADETSDQTAENDSATSETQTPTVEPAIAAGEAAFLYEEAVGATGANRDEGGVVWTLAQEAPEAGAAPEAVIKGLVEIPARGLKLNLSVKRNVDPGLPASHIIELLFTAPPDFTGGNIDNVSRFVMKASEQARGESLVGVPARIDAGFFLIALNNLDQAQQTNTGLLENGNWIDIPVAYVTGRRGLITLAKGDSGEKVFADALADWRNR